MNYDLPRVMIAGTHSGSGKSTITMGLLMELQRNGYDPCSFKAGPDYLDPMHHTLVLGKECRNLDTWMFPQGVREAFIRGAIHSGTSVVEGVMGMYDGLDGTSEEGSSAHLAKSLDMPVILVIDVKGTARSAGAIASGFKEYDKDVNFAGVIFNRVGSERHLNMLESSLRGIDCFGGVMKNDCMSLESRHLGLVPATERFDPGRYEGIADHVGSCVDIDGLMKVAKSAPHIEYELPERKDLGRKVRIGVAKDPAFNFYYIHNIESLMDAGAEIVYFSPINDDLPDVDGLYFGGGYPELYCSELATNEKMLRGVKKASEDGMPIYAECGGLIYLSSNLMDMENKDRPMCNVFDARTEMSDKKMTLGYVEATSLMDTPISKDGWTVRGHEFHYSKAIPSGNERYAFELSRGKGIIDGMDGMISENTLASYLHIHFASNPKMPVRFVEMCNSYKRS